MSRYPKQPLSAEAEKVKHTFLVNIGKVINGARTKKGMALKELGKKVGLSHSQVIQYEDGKNDIKASLMAQFSVALGFPIEEYAIEYNEHRVPCDDRIPIDHKFKELVEYSCMKKATSISKSTKDDLPPKPKLKFDRELYKWVIDEDSIKEKPTSESLTRQNISDKNIEDHQASMRLMEQEEAFSKDYIEHIDMSGKKDLLEYAYKIKFVSKEAGLRESKTRAFIRAALKFITSDADKATQSRLQAYMDKTQDALCEVDK